MGKVYRVGSVYETVYLNTAKEAYQCKPGGEEPESVKCLDAADECNQLLKIVEDADRTITCLRMLLEDLVNVCPGDVLETDSGRLAYKFCTDNPLPPADSANRDGQRSYGV